MTTQPQRTSELYAHSPNAEGKWHILSDHLATVAALSRLFAERFGAGEIGKTLGLLHDIGKFNPDFQRYLRQCWQLQTKGGSRPQSAPHSIYGGLTANRNKTPLLAFAAAGHHGGIPDPAELKARLANAQSPDWMTDAEMALPGALSAPELPEWTTNDPTACEFLVRMLFSCLVDADWLDTEAHFNRWKTEMRGNTVSMADLWQLFERDQRSLMDGISETTGNQVNQARREIYEACLSASSKPQGVYRLTVPTGGGKTRSAMGFALQHAIHHSLNRIIFAIPYTSIIDQNAQVYKSIFGEENVLEHHSSVDVPSNPTEEQSETELQRQLSAENWDMPIVVTTTVQLFESLFSNKPGKCRKLHNIAKSVIVLDEVQTLPIGLLTPILSMLRELVDHYGVTLVLSTATQPAFAGESPYLKGFCPQPAEMVPEPKRYFDALKRVEYEIVREKWPWERAADEIRKHDQVLCVVNSRKDALLLFDLLNDASALHLSALMCPAHRRDTIDEIKRRLATGEPCRVISTQVVEAGVDLDFPVVFRAMGPLDRIVQAAGRCNREGKLECGRVIVFEPEEGRAPEGIYKLEMELAPGVLYEKGADIADPKTIERYFGDVYRIAGRVALDNKGVTQMRKDGLFKQVADAVKLIEQDTVPVVVPYRREKTDRLLQEIEHKGFATKEDWRKLQQYSVSIYRWEYELYARDRLVKEVIEGLSVWQGLYGGTGIPSKSDPSDLIA